MYLRSKVTKSTENNAKNKAANDNSNIIYKYDQNNNTASPPKS